MKVKVIPPLSQSYIKDAIDKDVCPKYLQYKYIDNIETDDEDEKNVMFRGRYFEWHLLGKTRDSVEPKFKPRSTKNKSGDYRPEPQVELDELIIYAKEILKNIGLDTTKGKKQFKLVSEDLQGHIDWLTNDIQDQSRDALYDVKYTETKYDDRYNGWADFETRLSEKIQATQYIMLHYLNTGNYVPFYFLVFGKSKWVRVIKVEIDSNTVTQHEVLQQRARELTQVFVSEDWAPRPEFMKCLNCDYHDFCKYKTKTPVVETFTI